LFTQPGVFSAYADVLFDSTLVRPVSGSTIDYSDRFTVVPKGSFSSGLIDELGAVSNQLAATNVRESLVATVRMQALASGTVSIRSEAADESDSDVLLFGLDDPIPPSSIAYGNVTLAIGQSFTVGNDSFTVAEDASATTLNVLANDVVVSGNGTLSVVSVTQPASGGTVTLTGGVVSFVPTANFNGTASFTYRVGDGTGLQQTGSVTVTVTPVNDPPNGVDDTLTVDQNSTNNSLNVLANDLIAPDTGETLTITAVGATSAGGTVSIASGGQSINYTPAAGFVGIERFTYTVRDGALTDTVQVTVTVESADNPPTAVNDSFPVTEDAAEATFNVLTNDTRDVDNQSFVISQVGTPSRGGAARISSDGTQFFYAPAANFAGTETVTYTLRDTGGGISVGTVTFTVTGVNDAPPIANPTINLNRGVGETLVLSLTDLPANVDANETLTIAAATSPTTAGGTARISNQTILYTPPSSTFFGTDTFTYRISDGSSLTSTGTITITVNNFTTRDLALVLPSSTAQGRVNGIMLKGTNLLGATVEVPLTYNANNAVFDNVLPGNYVIEIPAVPFLQNASTPRQIPVLSAETDGDAVIQSGIGRLRPEFVSIRDWLGSAPQKSLLVAVAPGSTSTLAMKTAATDTINNPVVELDSTGSNVTIRGTRTEATATTNVQASIPTSGDRRVQLRGEQNGLRIFKISVESTDVTFTPSPTTSAAGEQVGEGELLAGSSTNFVPAAPLGVLGSSNLSLGASQAEGESMASAALTQVDLVVPVLRDGRSRTDVAVLSTPAGELWTGQPSEAASDKIIAIGAIDSAMQKVAENLSVQSSATEEIAVNSWQSGLNQAAVDVALASQV
jgi:large repetitive protein